MHSSLLFGVFVPLDVYEIKLKKFLFISQKNGMTQADFDKLASKFINKMNFIDKYNFTFPNAKFIKKQNKYNVSHHSIKNIKILITKDEYQINYDSLRKYIFLICDKTTTQNDVNMYIKDFYTAYPCIYDIDMPF
jgi:hypothetical protein